MNYSLKVEDYMFHFWEFFMALFKNRNVMRIAPDDCQETYLVNKFRPGENVVIDVENSCFGQQFVISANKTEGRKVRMLSCDGQVSENDYLVVVDASKNHVVVTLPPTRSYLGQLNIVCLDATYGIELATHPCTSNEIFDLSNVNFHFRGDAISLVCDRGDSLYLRDDEEELSDEEIAAINAQSCNEGVPYPGTWYVVGRYAASWYA